MYLYNMCNYSLYHAVMSGDLLLSGVCAFCLLKCYCCVIGLLLYAITCIFEIEFDKLLSH